MIKYAQVAEKSVTTTDNMPSQACSSDQATVSNEKVLQRTAKGEDEPKRLEPSKQTIPLPPSKDIFRVKISGFQGITYLREISELRSRGDS